MADDNAMSRVSQIADWDSIKAKIRARKADAAGGFDADALKGRLKAEIKGQDHVIDDLAATIDRYIGKKRDKPLARFMFFGPTGTGKTELSKALSLFLFKKEALRLDFGQLTKDEKQLNTQLFGMPKGYVNATMGRFARELGSSPDHLVLLDEVEKAPATVFDAFLNILDEGYAVDAYASRRVDFTKSVVIMTGNAEQEELLRIQQDTPDIDERQDRFKTHLRDAGTFRPELLGRIDDIFVFKPLDDETIAEIIIQRLPKAVAAAGMELVQVNDEAVLHLQRKVSARIRSEGGRAFDNVIGRELDLHLRKASRLAGGFARIMISLDEDEHWTFEGAPPPDASA